MQSRWGNSMRRGRRVRGKNPGPKPRMWQEAMEQCLQPRLARKGNPSQKQERALDHHEGGPPRKNCKLIPVLRVAMNKHPNDKLQVIKAVLPRT